MMTITEKIAMEIGPPSLSAGMRPNCAAASGAAPAAVKNKIDILTTSQKILLASKKDPARSFFFVPSHKIISVSATAHGSNRNLERAHRCVRPA